MPEKPSPPSKKPESVWDYPRLPAVEDVPDRIRIIFNGEMIVDTQQAKRVLETSHPPTYYIPLADIRPGVLQSVPGRSWCEWKGAASYYDVVLGDQKADKAAWIYPEPTAGYRMIREYVAFYPSKMEACFVGDERVKPQAGDFYGGWVTSNIVGPFKGEPGTAGW